MLWQALYPWNKCPLRTADSVAKAWGEKQVELMRDFSQVLLQMQKRTSGTLGFTLQDEARADTPARLSPLSPHLAPRASPRTSPRLPFL